MGYHRHKVLLDANTTVANSDWIPGSEFDELTLAVSGIVSGDVVQVQGSNDKGVTAAPTNVEQIGSDITADGVTEVTAKAKWVRVRRSAVTGAGSVTVVANGYAH